MPDLATGKWKGPEQRFGAFCFALGFSHQDAHVGGMDPKMPLHLYLGLLAAVIVAGGLTVLFVPDLGGAAIIVFLLLALAIRRWTR
jgi:hypothetical protein